jgi:hypothetical protein
MKLAHTLALATAAFGLSLSSLHAQNAIAIGSQAVLGGWDFNNILTTNVGTVNARYSDTFGDAGSGNANIGTLYFNGSFGSDAWTTVTRVQSGADIDRSLNGRLATAGLGSLSGAEGMMSLTNLAPGTKDEFSFKIHTLDNVNSFENINLSLYAKDSGTGGGSITINWFYSTDGGATKVNTLLSSVVSGASFAQSTVDFSSVTAMNGVADLFIIGEVVESIGTANLQFDNVAFYGTSALSAIPEPSTYAAILAGALGVMFLRRRMSGAAA